MAYLGAFNSLINLKGDPRSTVGENCCLLPEPPSYPFPGGLCFYLSAVLVDA